MRPLGAVFFGHIGDRIGRRHMLLHVGRADDRGDARDRLLPTHAQVGAAAGWLLFLLRCVMGFSVGGEYTGVVAYLLEGAPPHRRGLVASPASAASEVGALLAVGVSALTVASMSEAEPAKLGLADSFPGRRRARRSRLDRPLDNGGIARIPPPAARTERPENPLRHSLTNHRAAIGRAFAISALGSITYYVGITYVPAFLTSAGALSEKCSLWLSTAAAVIVILVTPFIGATVGPHRPKAGPAALALGNVISRSPCSR